MWLCILKPAANRSATVTLTRDQRVFIRAVLLFDLETPRLRLTTLHRLTRFAAATNRLPNRGGLQDPGLIGLGGTLEFYDFVVFVFLPM